MTRVLVLLVLLAVAVAVRAQVTSVESDLAGSWISGDIGTTGTVAGRGAYRDTAPAGLSDGDTFTVSSSAPNIAGVADSFRYVCRPVVGETTLTARVGSMTGANFAQAGVMVRASLDADAAHAFLFRFPTANTVQQKVRAASGGQTTTATTGLAGDRYPWLRLTRTGASVAFAVSETGATWTSPLPAASLMLPETAFWCLATTSVVGQESVEAVATIDGVALDTAPPPPDPPDPPDPTPADDFGGLRPSYQGFGAAALGGAGDATKRICIVTSRANTGGAPTAATSDVHTERTGTFSHDHGTYNQCTQGRDASYVLFDVSGYAELGGCRSIAAPYLTVAGQTAPSPGVALRNGCVQVDARDQVFQHVRIRCGAAQGSVSGVFIRGANSVVVNTVLDHVSISWCGAAGVGQNVYIGGDQENFTQPAETLIVDAIVAENLGISAPMGMGLLAYAAPAGTFTLARTFFAHNGNRNPWVSAGQRAVVYNNYAYNAHNVSGSDGTYGFTQVIGSGADYVGALIELVYAGNVNQAGPSTIDPDGTITVQMDAEQVNAGGAQLYLADNVGPRMTGPTPSGQWAGVSFQQNATRANSEATTPPDWYTAVGYRVLPSAQVKTYLEANAGAWPTARDALDARVLGDMNDGGSSAIKHENEVGGFGAVPLAETTRPVVLPANPFGAGACGRKTDGTARSVIECWLDADPTFGARRLEPANRPTARALDPVLLVVVVLLLVVAVVAWRLAKAV